MTPLIGFAPDLPTTTPGILTECVNFVPYESGFEAANTGIQAQGTTALASPCRGAAVLEEPDISRRVFAGTASKLYELVGSTWVDQSRVGDYSLGLDTSWCFAQFGAVSLASNFQTKIQKSVTGVFADIAQAPKAKIVFTVNYYVVALGIEDGAVLPAGWACSDKFAEDTWTPLPSNLADTGELLSVPGQITAGNRLGDLAVAYKEKAIYVGTFVESSTQTIDWRQIPGGDAGCIGQDALCVMDGMHFFLGADNFWIFDGSRPVAVGEGVRQWFFDNSDPLYRYKTKCVYDRQKNRVIVSYPAIGANSCNRTLVYHVKSKMWGKADLDVQTWFAYVTPSLTIDGLDAYSSTIDGLPDIPLGSQYWAGGGKSLAYFDTSNRLMLLSGAPASSSLTTGDTGDDTALSMLSTVRFRYASGYFPASASIQCFYKMNLGSALVSGSSGSINDGKFDARQSGRFHRVRADFLGSVRVEAINAKAVAAGLR